MAVLMAVYLVGRLVESRVVCLAALMVELRVVYSVELSAAYWVDLLAESWAASWVIPKAVYSVGTRAAQSALEWA
jgi:hypothetical protein